MPCGFIASTADAEKVEEERIAVVVNVDAGRAATRRQVRASIGVRCSEQ